MQCIILLTLNVAGDSRQMHSLLRQYLSKCLRYADFGQIDLDLIFEVTVTVISKRIGKLYGFK